MSLIYGKFNTQFIMPHTQHYNTVKGTNDFREGEIDLGNKSFNRKSLKNFFVLSECNSISLN